MKSKYNYIITLAKVNETEEENAIDCESIVVGICDTITNAKCYVANDLIVRARDLANSWVEEDDLESYERLFNEIMDSNNINYQEAYNYKEEDFTSYESKPYLKLAYLDINGEENAWYIFSYSITRITK